jgi:hypothetical protein
MLSDAQIPDDFMQRRLQRLELRRRRAHFVLAGALAVYESLRAMPHAQEPVLRQALQRIERAQQAQEDIQSMLEYLEDDGNGA